LSQPALGVRSIPRVFYGSRGILPAMISVIDSAEKLEQAAAIERIMSNGLIVMSEVEVIRIIHASS
jgi:hypothetical protein